MKKTILISAGVLLFAQTFAQKANIQSANNSLRDKEYTKALEYIEKATNDPSTKDDAKAWFIKGTIYSAMQAEKVPGVNNPYRNATEAYFKTMQLKSSYEKEYIDQELLRNAMMYYNDAANSYNAKAYDDAIALSKKVVEIHDVEGGKRFAGNKQFDTISVQAQVIQAYSAYYGNKPEEAVPALTALKNNPINNDPSVYLVLADIYEKQNKEADMLAILTEGRQKYPDNKNIRNADINYYIRTGKQAELTKKLEEAVAKDPNNVDLLSNLADTYTGMAFPKDAQGKELAQPANYTELLGKAEESYNAALKADPNNAGINYNAGVLLYNQATEVNKQMNNIKGNSAAETKKFDELKAKRDGIFSKAVPYFEKTIALLDAKGTALSADDKFTYQSTAVALKEIYVRQDKMDKASQMKAKLEAMKK